MSNIRTIIYPASRPLSPNEKEELTAKVSEFLKDWSAHGNPLSASLKIEYNQFLIILVDETQELASGCSLDVLNGIMRELDQDYHLGLFDRMKACFIQNQTIQTMPLVEFRSKLKEGKIPHHVSIFDFSVSNDIDFSSRFLLPLEKSWANLI